jgi:hypothetical protein
VRKTTANAILVLIDTLMHLPEQAMRAGEFGALRCRLSVGVHLGEREMAEDEAQPPAIFLLDQLDGAQARRPDTHSRHTRL